MTIYLISAISFIAGSSIAAFIVYLKMNGKLDVTRSELEAAKVRIAIAEQSEKELEAELKKLEAAQDELLVRKTEAETRMASLSEQMLQLENSRKNLEKDKDEALTQRNQFERERDLTNQRIATIEREMLDWEKTKIQHMDIVKASVFEVGQKVGDDLLNKHKHESEAAKKESEKIVKQTTEELRQKFENVFQSMNTLHDRVEKASSKTDIVHNSLLNPTGAGSLAEITLENIFKNSGLIKDQDYRMQYNVKNAEGSDLRPDAVVFLPDDNIMVVDSKASKFFTEIGGEVDEGRQEELGRSLKVSMNQHLKGLAGRNYSKAIEEEAGKSLARVYMFLPTEVALEKLRKSDAEFMNKAYAQGILPVGPTGLLNELLRATMVISDAKQQENSKVIINKVRELLNGVAVLYGHAGDMGKSLKSAMDKYDKFSGSFNRTFMSKAKEIDKLGVGSSKLKEVDKLPQYKTEKTNIREIEGLFAEEVKELEAEEVE